MAKGYRPVDRDQPFLLPPDIREWLPPDHPVFLVITVVADHLDTAAFHARRRTGGAGTAGYDPDMLVTVLVRAYAHGVTSSRPAPLIMVRSRLSGRPLLVVELMQVTQCRGGRHDLDRCLISNRAGGRI